MATMLAPTARPNRTEPAIVIGAIFPRIVASAVAMMSVVMKLSAMLGPGIPISSGVFPSAATHCLANITFENQSPPSKNAATVAATTASQLMCGMVPILVSREVGKRISF